MSLQEELGEWLMKNHVPSIGPPVGISLMGIASAVEDKMDHAPIELRPFLRKYVSSLYSVCRTLALHQGTVLATLEAIVEQSKKEG